MPTYRFMALSIVFSACLVATTATTPTASAQAPNPFQPAAPAKPDLQKVVPSLSFQLLGTPQLPTPETAAQPQIPLEKKTDPVKHRAYDLLAAAAADKRDLTREEMAELQSTMPRQNKLCYAIRSYNYAPTTRTSPDITTPTGSTTCAPSTQAQLKMIVPATAQSAKPR